MLERVLPYEISYSDLKQLQQADEHSPDGCKLALHEIVDHIWNDQMQLFRTPCGVMLTEKIGKRLNIVRMEPAGKLALRAQEFLKALQHIARDMGCNAVETCVYSEKLARTLRRGGAKQESVTMVLELSDG